ncbi:hypothetical protein FRC03_011980 [Tulasnella sp. 419]|nr:hypothetical protein FRC03_011980 [Tulasnella sp. 419]
MSYDMPEATPSLSDELKLALGEQNFGIKYYRILDGSEFRAEVGLLDDPQRSITVAVTENGWEVVGVQPVTRYPTLDDLLRNTSQSYAQREQDILMSKLQELADKENAREE